MRVWNEEEAKLRGRIAKVTGCRDAVDDLVQDVFLKAYSNREGRPPVAA